MISRFKPGDLVMVTGLIGVWGYDHFPLHHRSEATVGLRPGDIMMYIDQPAYIPPDHEPCARFLWKDQVIYVCTYYVIHHDSCPRPI